MDFREDLNARGRQQIPGELQQFPHLRLHKETVGTRFLGGVGKGIQADDGCVLLGQKLQTVAEELPGDRGIDVQIDLLF